jgi:threonine/homoserine/homoserine lactone efflux protein
MVPLSHVLTFAAVVSVLIAVPGPSVLFTISRALTVGRRAALLTVVGNELGLCVQLVAVAFGVGAVVERSAEILTAVKFAGPRTWSSSAYRRSGTVPRWPRHWPRACRR